MNRKGLPSPSTVMCTLALTRPDCALMPGRLVRPLFRGAGGVGMGADDGTVDDEVFGIRVIGQALVERGSDAAVAPVDVASVDGVPFAVFRRQHSPGRARAGNPEYDGNEASAIGFTAAVEVGAAAEEGEDFVPLVGRMSVPSLPCRNDNTKNVNTVLMPVFSARAGDIIGVGFCHCRR